MKNHYPTTFKNGFTFAARLIKDLYYLHFAKPPEKKSGFAFIVHPRGFHDVYRTAPFFKFIPKIFVEFILSRIGPVTVSEINGFVDQNNVPLAGLIISCPLMATQLMKDRSLASRKIIEAARLAEKYGAKYIGLGALSGSVTRGGLDLIESGIQGHITTGRSYTAHNVSAYALDALKETQLHPNEILIGILGAAGGVGL